MEKELLRGNRVLGRRIGAFITDHIIICFIAMIPLFFNFNKLIGDDFINFGLFYTCGAIAMAMYLVKDTYKGRSIGKLVFGLRIREYESIDSIPPLYKLIIRNILIFLWPVEGIVMLTDKEGRRLGDKIVRTQVVGHSEKITKRVIVIGIIAFVLFVSSLFIGVTQIIRNDDSYKTAVSYIQSNTEIESTTGNIKGFGLFPSGSINITNGYGESQLSITVIGEKRNIKVDVLLEKGPDTDWVIKDVRY